MSGRDKFADEYRKLLEGLIGARKAKGLTQHEVAHEMGIKQPMLSKLEAGQQRLDLPDFIRYCRAVGLDPRDCIESLSAAAAKPQRPASPRR